MAETLQDGVGLLSGLLPKQVVGDLEDYCTFSPYIRKLNKEYAELRRLTDLFNDIQNRWGIYLQLSNSTYQVYL